MRLLKYLFLLLIAAYFISCFPGYGDDDGNIPPVKTYGWQKVTLDSNQYGYLGSAVLFNNAIYTGVDSYFYKSTDMGTTWNPWFTEHFNYLRLFADSASLFLSTDRGIYRMNKTETLPKLVSDKNYFTITASNNDYLYGVAIPSGAQTFSGYLSTDHGATWSLIADQVTCACFNNNYLYFSGNVTGSGYSIYRYSLSENKIISTIGGNISQYGVFAITAGGGRLYASAGTGIYYFDTTKLAWAKVFGKGGLGSFYNFGNNIYIGISPSLYFSIDSGYTWREYPVPDESYNIANIFELDNYIYLQAAYSLWRLPLSSL
jgi:hypothetical protein